MILRPASLDDVPALAKLGRESFCATFEHLYAPADLAAFLEQVYSERAVAEEIAGVECIHRLAFDGDALVGFCKLRQPSWYADDSDAANPIALGQLYTDPARTGEGIGAALMEWAIAEARGRGCDAIQLSVWSENFGAQRFYRRYGFARIADIQFQVGEQLDDEFLYELRLGSGPKTERREAMSSFGAKSTADEVLAGKDLTGRTAFITGGYSGLGRETARAMAAKGAHVVIAGRDLAKGEAAASEIATETGNANIEAITCDLGSLDAVRACGSEARERLGKIDLLINNAGVMACPYAETADGFELQFGTNHLGHFLLTRELMPLLEKGEQVRIVNLSSRGHHIAPVDFDDPNFDHRPYDKWQSYGNSKTANILFAVGLEERFGGKGMHAVALHPGGIVTNLGRHLDEVDVAQMRERFGDPEETDKPQSNWKTIPQGAATTCWAATCDELEGRGGVYCEDCHVAPIDAEDVDGGVRPYAVDTGNANRLWALSEKLVGESFPA